MEFGVFALNPAWLDGHWRELEASPFAALYVADHPSLPGPEPWTFLAHAAAQTHRIRLGTHVTGAPFHNAAQLARTVASVDRLSGGRAVLGLGTGWMRADFQALRIPRAPFAERVARLDALARELPGLVRKHRARASPPSAHHCGGHPAWAGVGNGRRSRQGYQRLAAWPRAAPSAGRAPLRKVR